MITNITTHMAECTHGVSTCSPRIWYRTSFTHSNGDISWSQNSCALLPKSVDKPFSRSAAVTGADSSGFVSTVEHWASASSPSVCSAVQTNTVAQCLFWINWILLLGPNLLQSKHLTLLSWLGKRNVIRAHRSPVISHHSMTEDVEHPHTLP